MRIVIRAPDEKLAITGYGCNAVKIRDCKIVCWPFQRCRRFSIKPCDVTVKVPVVVSGKRLCLYVKAIIVPGADDEKVVVYAYEKYAKRLAELENSSIIEATIWCIAGEVFAKQLAKLENSYIVEAAIRCAACEAFLIQNGDIPDMEAVNKELEAKVKEPLSNFGLRIMKIHADLRLCISQPASAVSHAPDSKDWGGNGADVGSQEAGKDVVIPRREKITEAVLKVAAGNEINGQEVLAALLDAEQNVKITDVVIEAAAANRGNGKEVMDLLLMKRGGDVKITEAVLKAAAANDVSGREVMTLLLEKCG